MDTFEEVKKLKLMLDDGLLTRDEYDKKKDELLGFYSRPQAFVQADRVPTSFALSEQGVDAFKELRCCKSLFDDGILTQDEFESMKASILGMTSSRPACITDKNASKHMVGSAVYKLINGCLYLLGAAQTVLTIVFLSMYEWFHYLVSFNIDNTFSPDAIAALLMLAGTALIVLSIRSRPIFPRGANDSVPRNRKILLVGAAVLGLAAIIPAVDAIKNGAYLTRDSSDLASAYLSGLLFLCALTFVVGCLHAAISKKEVFNAKSEQSERGQS